MFLKLTLKTKVGCDFLMTVWPKFRMGQHREDAPDFNKTRSKVTMIFFRSWICNFGSIEGRIARIFYFLYSNHIESEIEAVNDLT